MRRQVQNDRLSDDSGSFMFKNINPLFQPNQSASMQQMKISRRKQKQPVQAKPCEISQSPGSSPRFSLMNQSASRQSSRRISPRVKLQKLNHSPKTRLPLQKNNNIITCSHSSIDIKDEDGSQESKFFSRDLGQPMESTTDYKKKNKYGLSTLLNMEEMLEEYQYKKNQIQSQISSPHFNSSHSQSKIKRLETGLNTTRTKLRNLKQMHQTMRRHVKSQRDRIRVLEQYCLKLNDRYHDEVQQLKTLLTQMAVGKTVQGITIRDENPQGTRCCEIM